MGQVQTGGFPAFALAVDEVLRDFEPLGHITQLLGLLLFELQEQMDMGRLSSRRIKVLSRHKKGGA